IGGFVSCLRLLGCNVKWLFCVGQVVTQNKRGAAADASVAVEVCEGLVKVLLVRLAGCFVRSEPRRKAGQYLRVLMSDLGKRNGWTVSEWIGGAGPAAVQRLPDRECGTPTR